jgi:hypothetical protein
MSENINCRACKFYYVTWDPKNPMGCRAYGFKSKQLPSIVVFKSTGERCNAFQSKK